MLAALALVLLVLVLLGLRQQVLTLLIAALIFSYLVWGEGTGLRYMALDAWDALNREVLLSIPLYLLAGNLMSRGSMAERLVAVLREATVFLPGGLALAAVLACAVFAAVSGSSTVTLAAVGAVMYPALVRAGYPKRLAIGALCAAGTLGIIIPPSIPLILYGVMTQVSIVDLFHAGIGPALVLTSLMAAFLLFACRRRPASRFAPRNFLGALRRSLWVLLMPVLVLGGIYSGYFTATEAAVVAVFYTLLIQLAVYRELSFADTGRVVVQTATLLGSLFPVLMIAVCLNLFLTWQKVPEAMIASLSDFLQTPGSFWVAVNSFLLLVGSVVDIGSAILILSPLLKPLAVNLDIDAVHFGIAMIVNLEIGYLTPPLGLNLIVAMAVFRESFREICIAVLPFIALMLIGLVIVVLSPGLSLFLLPGGS